jgi:HK97 family phage major capsid protein
MTELQRILSLTPAQRTEADLVYLESHKPELTPEQIAQLESEKTPAVEPPVETPAPEVTSTPEITPAPEATPAAEATPVVPPAEDSGEDEVVEAKSVLTKKIGTEVHKAFQIEIKEMANGHLEAIVNSGQEDRSGEILDMKGLDIKTYMKNPVLANGHDYSKPSVGRTHKLTKRKDGSLDAEFEFATDIDGYDEPKILDQLYRKGYQFAFSIGFIPKEVQGNVYTTSEMIEFSPVLIGADARALLKSKALLKQKGIDIGISDTHNDAHMKNLAEILAKSIEDLTLKEIAILKEHKAELSAEQLTQYASVLEEKAVDKTAEKVEALEKEVADMKANESTTRKSIAIAGAASSEITKEVKLFHYLRGLKSGNFKEYIDVMQKAATDPMSTSNTGEVVPPAEFIAEIQRLEEEVGVAARYATVRRSTNGAGLIYVLGDDDLTIYDTAEGGKKKSTSLTYDSLTLAWRKFAGILPMTDELTADSAIDLWNDATQRFARAFARRGDELVFTEVSTGGVTKDGILNVAGTNIVTLSGDSIEDLSYDDLVEMIYGVPSQSGNTGSFFGNRSILGVLMKLKDENSRPLWNSSLQEGAPGTILGRPFVQTEVLPGLTASESDLPFLVYGDLRYATLGERTDVQMKVFDAGTVGGVGEDDDDGHAINLLTQDAQALRAVKRMNAVVRFPAAFSVAVTATGS